MIVPHYYFCEADDELFVLGGEVCDAVLALRGWRQVSEEERIEIERRHCAAADARMAVKS